MHFKQGKFLLIALLAVVLGSWSPAHAEDIRYTKYNIHTNGKPNRAGVMIYKASYANYTSPADLHKIIPAGSKIRILDRSRKQFIFETFDEEPIKVYFEFHEARMRMDIDAYIDLITSPDPVDLSALSELDQEGVKQGKALIGMTKHGVMVALGYPAANRTPSPAESTWVYWTNRFATISVDFDLLGRVEAVHK